MQSAISLYLYWSGKRGKNALIDAVSTDSNEDCGRLNLMCPVCLDRVYLSRRKGQRFFAHWPNSENQDCEIKFIASNTKTTERQIVSAINKERADYERYFWLAVTEVYPVVYRLAWWTEKALTDDQTREAYSEVFYPVFRNCKAIVQELVLRLVDSRIEKTFVDDEEITNHDRQLLNRILKQQSKMYRSKACLLLVEFLYQKKSRFLVERLWALSIAMWVNRSKDEPQKVPKPSIFIPFVINVIVNLLIWIPWDNVIHDLKVFGKIKKRNRYSSQFDLVILNELPDMPEVVNAIPSKTDNKFR